MSPTFCTLLAGGALALFRCGAAALEPISPVWITEEEEQPGTVTINWETGEPAGSQVVFHAEGGTPEYGGGETTITAAETTTLHHVRIPASRTDVQYVGKARSGTLTSDFSFQSFPTDELRVAVVADTGYTKADWAGAVLALHPHLLLTAGDNVPALHETSTPVDRREFSAFRRLVAAHPELYRSVIWMPALGNHDREIAPRGAKAPEEPTVYDVEATAFREFFALPAPEWHWEFAVADFGVRFVAADLSHLSDQGTGWQTCHSPKEDGEQYAWFSRAMTESREPFLIPLYNEKQSTVRGLEHGAWLRALGHASLAITGFGYFAERAEANGLTWYNTSVNGTGAKYPDPGSTMLKSEDNFVLLVFRRKPLRLTVELRSLTGQVLDTKDFAPRPGTVQP